MASTTVRISERSHQTLKTLAQTSGRPLQDVLEDAIERERQRQFFDDADAAYARLRASTESDDAYTDEMRELEGTLLDGLESPATTSKARKR